MRVYLAILLSIAVHLVIYWLAPAEYEPGLSSKETPIEVHYVDTPKPVVRDSLPPEELIQPENKVDEKEPAALWSKEERRVKKQTQAEATGLTQNRQPKPKANPAQEAPPEEDQASTRPRVPNLMKLTQQHFSKIDPQKQAATDLKVPTGVSTRGESLIEDIEVGQFTALNVDPYLYYSFFARIEELIRFRWEDAIKETIYSLNGSYIEERNSKWITYLEIELDRQGAYIGSRVMRRSGLRGFDIAAIRAFRESHNFPNPPDDLIGDDGRVILQYAFEVRWDPRRLVRRR